MRHLPISLPQPCVAAAAKLAEIPLAEQPDIDFYNLFTALIEDLITNPTPEYDDNGSGKAEMPLAQAIEAEALSNTKAASTILAQSIKVQWQQSAYDRNPNYKAETAATDTETAPNPLYVTPNPAQNNALFAWDKHYSGTLILYDYTGKVAKQQAVTGKSTTIDVSNLPNGTFIARLVVSHGTTIAVGKIAVMK